MPAHHHEELGAFAAILTQLLPGTWTHQLRRHTAHDDQVFLTADVWDMNQIAEAVATTALTHDAILTRDDGLRLFLMDHPRHEDTFLIAAMAPADTAAEAFRGVPEPDGIAISDDPEQAADAITTRLLPRHETALAHVRDNAARLTATAAGPHTVEMTWTEDGALTAAATSDKAAGILAANGFVHDPDRQAYVLSGDDTAVQARHVRTAGTQLAALGIGVALRRPTPITTVDTTPVPVPRQHAAGKARSR
ncbi:hypothetical protein LG634_02180 [Streptomyces bambusae]|uniref:hypothetical protein n=1 Tax=Streptomyces bambusae TaxID=1550616 RepID=UPI001CFEBDB0|nr:hypothetical protein [Streptomyces bambusae]MCB5163654.1 hypothetical protein [Streptomyces bambusae]